MIDETEPNPVCEVCHEETPAEELTLTADSHHKGPNLFACEQCIGGEPT